ncbi:hypothetical protein EPUS_00495 [Endocarpon pusillum Z07020]|uniref:FAD-binding domain-containing protein n=1 Tax=Endocarpon pusillum (strain Z07020 / HMAS-L-300199) TaxID=1263415 RepID=U1GI69_ENDPU|nr:uncharacterized protein EPUS_00495 [Endocarpon pusillum Z07020]ERF71506.1 hypothetical protein EPUS_00495 [Endocarpon pusillum Z07020]
MNPAPHPQVLIIGGGIGGLTLAVLCRKLNISYLVLERSKKFSPVGAGISLAPNALRVLDQLGLYEDIVRHGQSLDKILIHRNKTKWRTLDFTCVKSSFGYPVYSIERHYFHHLLYQAADGDKTVLLDSTVVDIIDDPTAPHVIVKYGNGCQTNADVVVGADGIRSVTRRILARQAGLDAKNTIRFTGRVHMSGYTAPMENLGAKDLGVGNWLFYDDAILTTWPCVDNRQWFIGVKKADLQDQEKLNRSVWANVTPDMVNDAYGEKFHPFAESGEFKDIVDKSERVIASNVFEEMDFPTMSNGRVALLGDAAHSMTSFFGQGACQAIEDATELANALQSYFSAPYKEDSSTEKPAQREASSLAQTLGAYSDKRGERAKALVSFSSNYAKVHTGKLPYGMGPLVRKLIFAYLPAWGWMWGLTWLYGYQPTVDIIRDPFS